MEGMYRQSGNVEDYINYKEALNLATIENPKEPLNSNKQII